MNNAKETMTNEASPLLQRITSSIGNLNNKNHTVGKIFAHRVC